MYSTDLPSTVYMVTVNIFVIKINLFLTLTELQPCRRESFTSKLYLIFYLFYLILFDYLIIIIYYKHLGEKVHNAMKQFEVGVIEMGKVSGVISEKLADTYHLI